MRRFNSNHAIARERRHGYQAPCSGRNDQVLDGTSEADEEVVVVGVHRRGAVARGERRESDELPRVDRIGQPRRSRRLVRRMRNVQIVHRPNPPRGLGRPVCCLQRVEPFSKGSTFMLAFKKTKTTSPSTVA